MKNGLIVLGAMFLNLVSAESFASSLSCWNLYAKKGAAPTVTAQIVADDSLKNVIVTDDANYSFLTSKSIEAATASATPITTTRSPYQGNQEFGLGGQVRLILPRDLSPAGLKNAIFRAGNLPTELAARQNGVLRINGDEWRTGDLFVRMHCVSR